MERPWHEHLADLAALETRFRERNAELLESEMRFRSVVESASDAIVIADSAGRIISWNRAAAAMFGYTADEVINRSIAMLMPPRYRNAHTAGMERAERMGEHRLVGRSMEFRGLRSDGTEFPLELSLATWTTDGRNFYSGILRDTTERSRAQQEYDQLQQVIMKSAREWQITFDAIESPIVLVDAEGSILRLNRIARDLLGAAQYAAALGVRLADAKRGEPWSTAAALIAKGPPEGSMARHEAQDDATGRIWEVEVAWRPVDETDVARAVVVARDVTATVELQASLRRSETLGAMGALVAGVAHEVRTPLFSIAATLDAFEAEFLDTHEEFGEYATVLRRQLDRLTNLMEDLLEYGRPTSFDKRPTAVGDVVAQAVEACAALAADLGCDVCTTISETLKPIPVDRLGLLQVVRNLVENALQHSPRDAEVRIDARVVHEESRDWVELRVLDCGPGFRPADLARVFEPFFTRRRGGTGLGLSIVQRIVAQHGGRVAAANRPEMGAVVSILLPISPPGGNGAW